MILFYFWNQHEPQDCISKNLARVLTWVFKKKKLCHWSSFIFKCGLSIYTSKCIHVSVSVYLRGVLMSLDSVQVQRWGSKEGRDTALS